MGFVKDDDTVLIFDPEVLPNLLIKEVVVRHENEVGARDSILRRIVGTILVLLGLLVNFFDVAGLPGHVALTLIPILVVDAWVDALLGGSACRIQRKALVCVDLSIHAEVVTGGNQDGPRLKHGIPALLLNLGELGMSTTAVDDLRLFDHSRVQLIPQVLVSLCLEPGEGGAKEREGLTSAGGALKQSVLTLADRLDHLCHVVRLASIRLEREVHSVATDHLGVLLL